MCPNTKVILKLYGSCLVTQITQVGSFPSKLHQLIID